MATEEDFLDFLPLYPEEDEPTIRERWETWANEGLSVEDSDQWTDVREGSFFWVLTSPGIREAARLYDLMGLEVPMSAFALWAWSTYLDDLGAPYGLDRLPATSATGLVRFTGDPAVLAGGEIEVPAGTRVGAESIDLDSPAPEYEVTEGGAIPPSPGYVDLEIAATEPGSAGNVGTDAITLLLTPISGVTVSDPEQLVGGTDPEDDEAYRDRLLAQYAGAGGGNAADYERWARDYPGVGRATVIPLYAGPGTVLVIVTTPGGNPVSAETVEGLQRQLDPPAWSTELSGEVTLPQTTIPVLTTEDARPETDGWIHVGDQLISYGSYDGTNFLDADGGTGTFPAGTFVWQSGRGGGDAPVGHAVVVKTATLLSVSISAVIEPEEGYSLDGFGGTLALRPALERAVTSYVNSVGPGGEIVLSQVSGRLVSVTGVHDVGQVEIQGTPANLEIPGDPTPRVPSVTLIDLVEGEAP